MFNSVSATTYVLCKQNKVKYSNTLGFAWAACGRSTDFGKAGEIFRL